MTLCHQGVHPESVTIAGGTVFSIARLDPQKTVGFELIEDSLDTTVVKGSLPGQSGHTRPAVAVIVTASARAMSTNLTLGLSRKPQAQFMAAMLKAGYRPG